MRRTPFGLSPPLALTALIAAAACGDGPDPPPADGAPEHATVLPAVVDAALFDTIGWPSEQAAFQRGATVYAYSCVPCHGTTGAGDGDYRVQGRPLPTPTFLRDDWEYAGDLDGLRARIHAGDPRRGMPHWSASRLAPRDADAVARYITWGLWRLR